MKSILALSALVATSYAGLADDWFAASITLDDGVEANWDAVQTGTFTSTGASVQVSAKTTQSVSSAEWTTSLDVTWFTYQEFDGDLMLWGSFEAAVSNDDNIAKNTQADTWAAIGSSANDQIVCNWTNINDNKVFSWEFNSVSDYFGGAADTENNVVDGLDQSGTTSTGGDDYNIYCVFQRPVYNTADPAEDLSLVGDASSVPALFVQSGSYSQMTTGAMTGSVVDLEYVTQAAPADTSSDESLADELEAGEEEMMESSVLLSASLATFAVAATLV